MNTRQTGKPIQNGKLSEVTNHQHAQAPISTNSFASLPRPKPGIESEIAAALQADFTQ